MEATDSTKIETVAGDYTLNIYYDEGADQPYNEGFILVTNGRSAYGSDRRIDIAHGDDPLMRQVAQALSNSYEGWDQVSGAALVRWLQLHGRRGVTVVSRDYRPEDASTDRNERICGVAWAPDDATDPDAYTTAALTKWQAWAEGNVFGWVLLDPSGESVESVWGYYGWSELDYIRQETAGIAAHDAEQRVQRVQRWDVYDAADHIADIPGLIASGQFDAAIEVALEWERKLWVAAERGGTVGPYPEYRQL